MCVGTSGGRGTMQEERVSGRRRGLGKEDVRIVSVVVCDASFSSTTAFERNEVVSSIELTSSTTALTTGIEALPVVEPNCAEITTVPADCACTLEPAIVATLVPSSVCDQPRAAAAKWRRWTWRRSWQRWTYFSKPAL